MWIILIFLALGTLTGVALRGQQRLLNWLERGATTAVYLLLFLLGISVGGNQAAMNALGSLGTQALLLSLSAIVGSVLLALLLYHWLFHNRH